MQKEPPINCFVIVVSSVVMQREMQRSIYGVRINFSCVLLLAGKVQKAHAQTLLFCLGTAVLGIVKSYKVVLDSDTSLQQTGRF